VHVHLSFSPGVIDTPILEDLQQGDALVKMKKEMESNVPLGRILPAFILPREHDRAR
jgi:hypothetical protein